MAVIYNIKNFKCFNQARNGNNFSLNTGEFTTNLVGNVGEKVKVTYDLEVSILARGDGFRFIDIDRPNRVGRIEQDNINFRDENIIEGDTFTLYEKWSNPANRKAIFTGVIDEVDIEGSFIEFTGFSGNELIAQSTQDDMAIAIQMQDRCDALVFGYGLLENEEQFNIVSKVTGEEQQFYGIVSDGSFTTFASKGILKGWNAPDVFRAQGVVTVDPFLEKTVNIEHTFIIQPYYTVNLLENIQQVVPPDNLQGDNSFKYAPEFSFRKALTDTNSKLDFQIDEILGETGFFGENFNGFNNIYTVDSVVFEDADTALALEGIQILGRTQVTITVSKSSGSFATEDGFSVGVSYLPSLESEYEEKKTDFATNFLYDNLSGKDDGVIVAGASIIESVEANIGGGGELVIEAIINYTTAQRLRLTTESNYLLWVAVEDKTLSAGNSDRVNLIADQSNYKQSALIDGLMTYSKFNILKHDNIVGNIQPADLNTWNEDGLLIDFEFYLDLSKSAVIEDLVFKLVAYETVADTYFELDSYNVPLNIIVNSGVQQIEVDTTRGYLLKDGDIFNYVKLTTGAKVGDLQYYSGQFAQKVKWQDWIKNFEADTLFYDVTKPNDNLNFKSSNYSALSNYQIQIIAESNLTGVDELGRAGVGFELQQSSNIPVFDYDESDDGVISQGVITLHDPDTLANTGGKILRDKNTLFRITWDVSPLPSVDSIYGIHRIQRTGSVGDDIQILSSIREGLLGDILKQYDSPYILNSYVDYLIFGFDANKKLFESGVNSFRIRESGADTEQTFLYDGVNVDKSGITSFIGANNAYVTDIFNFNGDGEKATEATLTDQMQYFISGGLNDLAYMKNTKGSAIFNAYLFSTVITLGTDDFTFVILGNNHLGSRYFSDTDPNADYLANIEINDFRTRGNATTRSYTDAYNANNKVFILERNGNDINYYVDNTLIKSVTLGSPDNYGHFEELIRTFANTAEMYTLLLFDKVFTSTERMDINDKINGIYGI